MAFDAARNVFLVGSLRHGTVSVVNRNGTVRTLVKDPKLVATVGIRVKGNLLYVTNSDNGGSTKSSPKTNLKLAGLGIYDVRTGKRVRYVTLKADGAPHFANDVAVGPDGTAYVTDSLSATIFKVPLKGKPSVLVTDKRLGGDGFGLNGIV